MGTTSLEPGQVSYLLMEPIMHEGMGGPHLFEVTIETDSPVKPTLTLDYRAFFGEATQGNTGG